MQAWVSSMMRSAMHYKYAGLSSVNITKRDQKSAYAISIAEVKLSLLSENTKPFTSVIMSTNVTERIAFDSCMCLWLESNRVSSSARKMPTDTRGIYSSDQNFFRWGMDDIYPIYSLVRDESLFDELIDGRCTTRWWWDHSSSSQVWSFGWTSQITR